jgi:hypothetical protein
MITEGWLTDWAAHLEAATARAVRDVLATYPFEPGEQRIGPPASAAELAELRERLPWIPADLVTLQRTVGPVSLPDIDNGYFLHPVDTIIGSVEGDGPDRIDEPVVVFGSNGGGDLYALGIRDGRVFRLRGAGYVGGVYEGGVTEAGTDLGDFLTRLLAEVTAFGATSARG